MVWRWTNDKRVGTACAVRPGNNVAFDNFGSGAGAIHYHLRAVYVRVDQLCHQAYGTVDNLDNLHLHKRIADGYKRTAMR
jgi:hypothetical protein